MSIPHPLPVNSETRLHLATSLNHTMHLLLLAEWQLRQAHWNTRGAWFFARHELFEQVGERLHASADMVAERIGALGYAAEMDPERVVRDGLPKLAPGLRHGETFLEELTRNMVRIATNLREGIDEANKLGDPITEDLLTEVARNVEKDAWFMRAHLDRPDAMPADLARMRPLVDLPEEQMPMSNQADDASLRALAAEG